MRRLACTVRTFLRASQSGAALIEFVVVLPFVLLLLFGAIEITRYIMITQKVERSGYVMGDILSQFTPEELTAGALNNVFQQYFTMMNPFGASSKQAVVLSSVTKDAADGKVKINWQFVGGGTLTNAKTISIVSNVNISGVSGVAVGSPAFQGPLDAATRVAIHNPPPEGMEAAENMVVAEVFFQYTPVINAVLPPSVTKAFNIGPRTLTRRTFFHPRNGDLDKVVSTKTCSLPWGGTIADGQYVTAWQSSSSPACPGCASQVRTCKDGILSGSYTHQDCSLNWTGITTQECDSALDIPQNNCEAGGGTFQRGPAVGKCGSEDKFLYTCCGGSPPPADPCLADGKGVGCIATDITACVGTPTSDGLYCCAGCGSSNCAGSTTSWNGAATGCSGTYTTITNGSSVTVTNAVAGKAGSVRLSCSAGSVSQSAATCTASGTSCPAATVSWTTDFTCSKATTGTLVSGASQTLIVSTKLRDGYCVARCNNGTLSCDAGYYCTDTGTGSCSTC